MTVTELCSKLQTLAHQGYAIYAIELHAKCDNCSSNIILDSLELEILESDDDKSVKLLFKNK